MEDNPFALAVAVLIVAWASGALFVMYSSTVIRNRELAGGRRPERRGGDRGPTTELGRLVMAAHEAAQQLDAAISLGGSEEVIAAARTALTCAANLSVELRNRELSYGSDAPEKPVSIDQDL